MKGRCGRCGKRKYVSFDAAIHAALASSRLFGKPFRVYGCYDGVWHTTKMEEEVFNAIQARSGKASRPGSG